MGWLGLGFWFGVGFTCERCAGIFGRAFRAIATPGPIDGYPRIRWRPSAVPTVHLSHFFVAGNWGVLVWRLAGVGVCCVVLCCVSNMIVLSSVVVVFILPVCAVCLFDFVVVVVVVSWVGLIPLFSITFSSSHQFTIIVVAFIVVPPSSCPTSILIA